MPPLIAALQPSLVVTTAIPSSGTFPISRTSPELEGTCVNEVDPLPSACPVPALWSHRWSAEAIEAMDPRSRGDETVLVVDDDHMFRLIVKTVLTKFGYGTVMARDGDEALTALELSAVTAVVTDVEMPRMTGTEFTRRARERWPTLPILIHSGNDEVETEVAGVIDRRSVYKRKNDPTPLIPRLLRLLVDGW